MKKVIEVIPERCLGCHTCEMECALAHSGSSDFVEAVQKSERLYPRIILERDGGETVPMHCRHCDDAPCISVCPTSAMSRKSPGDPVVLDPESCIGCSSCILVCPFGIIQSVTADNILTKCDLCADRLDQGENPACVESCPTGAIRFTPVEDLTADRRKEVLNRFQVSLSRGVELKEK